jgi:hypothetical protein
MTTQQISFPGIEFPTSGEAIQHTYAAGIGTAISIGGRYFAVYPSVVDDLSARGIAFYVLGLVDRSDGQVVEVRVPIN